MASLTLDEVLAHAVRANSRQGTEINRYELEAAYQAAKRQQPGDAVAITPTERSTLMALSSAKLSKAAREYHHYLVKHTLPKQLALIPPAAPIAPKPSAPATFLIGSDGRAPRPEGTPQRSHATNAMWSWCLKDRDAATAWVTGNNVDLHTKTYDYGTGKPRDSEIVSAVPKDGVLDLTVTFQPSDHVGNFEKYARENYYNIWVAFPDGTTKTLTHLRNTAKGNPEYATAWDIKIPLMKGVTTISGSPEETGPDGYIERRATRITWGGE